MSESVPPPRLDVGQRVICKRQGPHDGKRGKVVSRIGEAVQVEFQATTLIDNADYFEAVTP